MKITEFENVVLITDDGFRSINTHIFHSVIRDYFKETYLLTPIDSISAKSNAISLEPIKFNRTTDYIMLDGFAGDCLLYAIFNLNLDLKKTLFILGVNEHNHWGYHNYVSATTSMLSLLKHFEIKGFSISSEIELSNSFTKELFVKIFDYLHGINDSYLSFNINEESTDFSLVKKSKALIDKFHIYETIRGEYACISYNRKSSIKEDEETDLNYQNKGKNYIVEVF
jgi:broad specificity polyphosphatase/5'/3'-nucleotidase SurE